MKLQSSRLLNLMCCLLPIVTRNVMSVFVFAVCGYDHYSLVDKYEIIPFSVLKVRTHPLHILPLLGPCYQDIKLTINKLTSSFSRLLNQKNVVV